MQRVEKEKGPKFFTWALLRNFGAGNGVRKAPKTTAG